ncbi:hypothetical protein BC835DRAFT_1353034, partial [Cytidiella melzeri]
MWFSPSLVVLAVIVSSTSYTAVSAIPYGGAGSHYLSCSRNLERQSTGTGNLFSPHSQLGQIHLIKRSNGPTIEEMGDTADTVLEFIANRRHDKEANLQRLQELWPIVKALGSGLHSLGIDKPVVRDEYLEERLLNLYKWLKTVDPDHPRRRFWADRGLV